MNTFKAISLGELIEKTDAAGLTDAKRSEKRSLQRYLTSHQGRQDTESSKGMLAAWLRRRCTTASRRPTRCDGEGTWRVPTSASLAGAN